MKFGPVPLSEAVGGILAHSVALQTGRLRKGRVIAAANLEPLRSAGYLEVTVAQLEPGDIPEDAAAEQLARALVPDAEQAGLRLGAAATGRVNIYAQRSGIVEISASRLQALNALHPMITVATVPVWQRVAARGMVATVKIISYAVPQTALAQACELGGDGLRLRSAVCHTADLIQTSVSGSENFDKGHAVINERMMRLDVSLGPKQVVSHEIDALAHALRTSTADILLILTGSATSDTLDVAPQALRAAGGEVTRFGMPVDPGNLLFFGALNGRPVVGLPGCARSIALNGADWVLERLICGVPLSSVDVAAMGVGGLLKEIPQRGRLREAD